MEKKINSFQYYISGLEKSFQFSGRSTRSEFWFFHLYNLIMIMLFILITYFSKIFFPFFMLYLLLIQIPLYSISVRRLHDVGFSGLFYLPAVISIGLDVLSVEKGPVVSLLFFIYSIILITLLCLKSESTTNKYDKIVAPLSSTFPPEIETESTEIKNITVKPLNHKEEKPIAFYKEKLYVRILNNIKEILSTVTFFLCIGIGLIQLVFVWGGIRDFFGLGFFAMILLSPFLLVIAEIPLIGTAFGIYGAYHIWHWNLLSSILFFTFPLVLMVLIYIMGCILDFISSYSK